MRYLLSMLLSFGSGMFQVSTASRLAADGSVTAWVGVGVLGVILFFQFAIMALVSMEAERAATKDDRTISISAGKAIIGGKLYDIPAQTYRPEDIL